uniref:Ribonuclease 1 n=1 Tax=Schistocephalus solidus TaxID=70667 RepID=A0A0X3PLQ6_SCHSO
MIFWFLYVPILCTLTLTTQFYGCSTASIPNSLGVSQELPRVIKWIDLIFRTSPPDRQSFPVSPHNDQSNTARSSILGPSMEWDYIVFSQSWTSGFCSFSQCSHPEISSGFNIHGLWPSIWPNKLIGNCSGAPPFNATALESIMDPLRKEWADVRKNKPLKFWHHEWAKHGSCAIQDKSIPNQLAYFQAALNLKQAFNATKIFAENGLRPSNRTEYVTESVSTILRMHLGHVAQLNCQWNRGGPASLIEFRVCFDRKLTIMDCPLLPIQLSPELAQMDDLGVSWTSPCPKTFVLLEKSQ